MQQEVRKELKIIAKIQKNKDKKRKGSGSTQQKEESNILIFDDYRRSKLVEMIIL